MSTKKTLIQILLVITLASWIVIINQNNVAVAADPTKLKISVGPTSVPADNNIYECIFVQLQDSNSRPARALQDTVISLSSSLTSVGEIESNVTITAGSTYAVAKFQATFTPGTTTIAAAASGYATVQTNVITVGPVPSKIAIYGFPPVLPADGLPYDAIVVQLQDSSGNPAKAPLEGIVVTLSSSNSTIASVPTSVTISAGQTYTLSSLISTAPGSAVVTAMTSGYTSTTTTITSQTPLTTPPKSLRLYVAPPKTLADNTINSQIVVELLDITGKITQQPETPISIQLTSANEEVGTIQPIVQIPTGKVYTTATFSSTYKAGSTVITVAATDLNADTETVTTIGPIPSKLVVYCNPSALPADNQAYNAIQVQLQDSSGKPALDPDGDVTVSLFSSEPTVGTVPTTLTIPYGKTYSTAAFTSKYAAGTTSTTAQASGYTTGLAQMKTYLIDLFPLTIAVTADPTTVIRGKTTNITAYVTDPGDNPTPGATVTFSSSNGGNFTTVKTAETGYYTTSFTAPEFDVPTNVTITATVSKTDYKTSNASILITVTLPTGTLQICIKDENGQPISGANVSTVSQPSGMAKLTGITNSTGYVAFPNTMMGNFTINVNKEGYNPMTTTVDYRANNAVTTLYLTKTGGLDTTTLLLILIPVIVVPVVLVVLYLYRRKILRVGENLGSPARTPPKIL
jgi:Carboxypeptidase regulatory-like domain